MAIIEIKNLSKTYVEGFGIKTGALKDVNLIVNKGDFISIAGPSGSGKTTLLNLIGALDKPSGGSIFYEGRDITAIPTHQLAGFRLMNIGFIFQAYNLINTLTAVENTEYIMLLQGIAPRARREKAIEVLKAVGLGDFMHRRPAQMSGGQQQRVAVARAIAAEPKVILADEPTANLDSVTANNLLDLMKRLNREKGISFIFSTHDRMVMDKADNVFFIRDGVIVA